MLVHLVSEIGPLDLDTNFCSSVLTGEAGYLGNHKPAIFDSVEGQSASTSGTTSNAMRG